MRHDLIAAVFAVGEEDDLVRLLARAEALQAFLDSEDGRNLLTAFRRAATSSPSRRKRTAGATTVSPSRALLVEPAEEALFAALEALGPAIEAALAAEDYAAAMAALGRAARAGRRVLRRVMVNAPEPDLRVNRLLLLGRIRVQPCSGSPISR